MSLDASPKSSGTIPIRNAALALGRASMELYDRGPIKTPDAHRADAATLTNTTHGAAFSAWPAAAAEVAMECLYMLETGLAGNGCAASQTLSAWVALASA